MVPSTIRCVYLLLLINFAYSGRVMRKIKERVHQVQYQRAKHHLLLGAVAGRRPVMQVKGGIIHQPLDHFDSLLPGTIPQRFFVNEAYWQSPDGPVFLYIGGESAISEYSVQAGHHVSMAEEHGALLVALEHRFYGESINPDGLRTENLRYLSSQQALADLVAFYDYISDRYSLSHKNTWISFGGSYPGSLSAWLRGKFPHLIYASVASSAPVKAKLDFSTYNKVVGESLMDKGVGGSVECVNAVWEAFAAVEAALLGGNETQAGKDFGCCTPPTKLEDQTELVQNLADIFMGSVQYNQEGATLSIDKVCTIMTNKSEEIEEEEEAYDRLVKLVAIYRASEEVPCLNISHDHEVLELSNTTVKTTGVGERQWYYQTCTEFGYYQTCEDAFCPFSRMLTLKSQTELCPLLFGIPQSSLHSNVAFTNKYYGGDHPQTHRVLYVNGDIDPWHELSVLQNGTSVDRDRAIVIKGTAHCANMNTPQASDPPALTEARREIEVHVARWLKTAAWEHM
ncbi:thymus-specific serine protease [Megalops cyprinoides]|uniref:thymus-specific serine protease n=1 Tax=Megalops cyprinoides TaxID=118141 RepID=UPI001865137E|nr:thymus-specific serine protease [Megalops cyprinoides]